MTFKNAQLAERLDAGDKVSCISLLSTHQIKTILEKI